MIDAPACQDQIEVPMRTEHRSDLGRQAILVLGMHRSGTSAVAGMLSALGVALPKKTLMGPHECNQRGLFESFALACVHDELLMSAGTQWHDWQQIDPKWMRSPAALSHFQRIKAVFADEFEDETVIVVKDPRICRFVQFTRSILTELNFDCAAILPVRNPLEVALSLQRRDGLAVTKSSLLWLRHVLEAEFYSRDMRRCFLSYEDLVRDWRPPLDRITANLGVAWPDRADSSRIKVEQFLTDELRHERASLDEIGDCAQVAPLVRDAYAVLMKIVAAGESDELLDQLDRLRDQFDEGCRTFGPAVAAEELATADKNLIAERNGLAAALNRLLAEHQALVTANIGPAAADEISSAHAANRP